MTAKRKYDNILTKEYLTEQHVINKRSLLDISKEIGCDHKTVAHYIHYHGISQQEPEYKGRKMKGNVNWLGYGDISKTQYSNIKNNARIRNIAFEVSIEDLWEVYLNQDGKCALSGVSIGFIACKKGNASLDRIDSTKPYTKDNIWWVHKDINLAKQSLSVNDFIELCEKVVTHAHENHKSYGRPRSR